MNSWDSCWSVPHRRRVRWKRNTGRKWWTDRDNRWHSGTLSNENCDGCSRCIVHIYFFDDGARDNDLDERAGVTAGGLDGLICLEDRRRRRRKFIRQSNQHSTKCKWRNEWLATKEGKPIELVAKIMECIIKLNNASHSWIIQINH